MSTHSMSRSAPATASKTDLGTPRAAAAPKGTRANHGATKRTKHAAKRTEPRAANAETGVTMMYQQGFTSGPSV